MKTFDSIQLAARLVDLSITCPKGFTVWAPNLTPPEHGWFVGGVYTSHEARDFHRIKCVDSALSRAKAIEGLAWKIEACGGVEQLTIDEFFFGGWYDEDLELFIFDVCTNEQYRDEAEVKAAERKQEYIAQIEAYRHIDNFKVPEMSKYEVKYEATYSVYAISQNHAIGVALEQHYANPDGHWSVQ